MAIRAEPSVGDRTAEASFTSECSMGGGLWASF